MRGDAPPRARREAPLAHPHAPLAPYEPPSLTVGYLNVNTVGVGKCDAFISQHDIAVLVETKRPSHSLPPVPGYQIVSADPLPGPRGGRSGGIAIYWRQQAGRAASALVVDGSNHLWVRLTGFSAQPLHLGAVYLPPASCAAASSLDSHWSAHLGAVASRLKAVGPVLIVGDFNARVGRVEEDLADAVLAGLDRDAVAPLPVRATPDETVDPRGRELLDLCTEAGICIVNGRVPGSNCATLGTSLGAARAHDGDRSTSVVVDYVLAPPSLLPSFSSFHVADQLAPFDHHALVFTVRLGHAPAPAPGPLVALARSRAPVSVVPPPGPDLDAYVARARHLPPALASADACAALSSGAHAAALQRHLLGTLRAG